MIKEKTQKLSYKMQDIDLSKVAGMSEESKRFNETYKLKNVTATVPDFIPKSELECYVRFVDGATYKLYVYLGKTVGWKSITLI